MKGKYSNFKSLVMAGLLGLFCVTGVAYQTIRYIEAGEKEAPAANADRNPAELLNHVAMAKSNFRRSVIAETVNNTGLQGSKTINATVSKAVEGLDPATVDLAMESASAPMTADITPEPATIALVSLGTFLLTRRPKAGRRDATVNA